MVLRVTYLKKIALLSDVNFPVRGRILEQTQYFYQTYLTEEARLSPEEFSMGLMQILYAKEPPENERVMELFNGLPPKEISESRVDFLKECGISQHFNGSRISGIGGITEAIYAYCDKAISS